MVPIPDPRGAAAPRDPGRRDAGSIAHPESGCRFHPRCPLAFDRCPTVDPPLYRGRARPRGRVPARRARPTPALERRAGVAARTATDHQRGDRRRHDSATRQRTGRGARRAGATADAAAAPPRPASGRGERVSQRWRGGADLPLAGHHHADHDDDQRAEQAGARASRSTPAPARWVAPVAADPARQRRGHEVGLGVGLVGVGRRREPEPRRGPRPARPACRRPRPRSAAASSPPGPRAARRRRAGR